MDQIIIDKLTVFGKHGVFPEENTLGQKFLVSVIMHTDTRCAGITDDLNCSVNYGEVCHDIQSFFNDNTFQLIERVAEELAQQLLLHYPLLWRVEVKIEKPWAPIGLPVESVGVQIQRSRHTAYIALGSNMGNKKRYLDEAVEKLSNHPLCEVLQVSEYITTEPYGGVEQDEFLNGALKLQTLLPPQELLDLLHQIENEAGRERTIHWGPRTLDLDILFYDDEIINTPTLTIPHIDLHNRDFVLRPMVQLAPYLRHPIQMQTMQQLLDAL